MNYEDLIDGALYQLDADVVNPHGDGRVKYDPTKEKVWPRGTRFRAVKQYVDLGIVEIVKVPIPTYFRLEFVDRDYHRYIAVYRNDSDITKERYGRQNERDQSVAVMAALMPCDEDWSAFAKRLSLGNNGQIVLRKLVEAGIVTLKQIEQAHRDCYAEDS